MTKMCIRDSANDVKSWDILWNKKYKDQIIMEDSVRDTFVPALKRLGFSSNSTDKKELETALDQLIEQKPLVYSYLVDESADEVVAGNASMALVYSCLLYTSPRRHAAFPVRLTRLFAHVLCNSPYGLKQTQTMSGSVLLTT